jgi:cytochrome P450
MNVREASPASSHPVLEPSETLRAPFARESRPSARAPGPKGLPFLGSVFPAWRDPLGLFMDTHKTYGDVARFKFGPYDYYLVSDPEVVRHVLVDGAKSYTKSRNYLGLKLVLGEGLLTSEGEFWRRQRKLAQPAFHKESMEGFARHMSQATRAMLGRWKKEDEARASGASRGRDVGAAAPSFCIHEEMMRLTFRIVGLTLFSTDVDEDAREVGQALTIAMHHANDWAESLWNFPQWVPTPKNVRFNRAMSTLDTLVYRIIENRREAGVENGPRDLLGMLMLAVSDEDAGDADARRMTNKQLRDEVITLVLAGHETTANLLAWTFFALSKHPEIEEKIREEANRVLGGRDPALEDVPKLAYTKMVIEEALRLYPPAWAFERQSTAPDRLGAFDIEKGAIVGVAPYVIHRHPAHWENPEAFDPLRFLPERAATRARYAYLPFGGGPRTCIGNHFAMMEAQIILAMLVREHRIALDPSHEVGIDPRITLRPKTGIKVTRRALAS